MPHKNETAKNDISPETTVRLSLRTWIILVISLISYTIIGYAWIEHRFALLEKQQTVNTKAISDHDKAIEDVKTSAATTRTEVLTAIKDGINNIRGDLKDQRDKLDRVAEEVARQGGKTATK